MKQGNITKRGARSFRIKIELDRDTETGRRRYHLETIKGRPGESVKDAKARAKALLVEIIDKMNKGQHVEHSTTTVAGYLRLWLDAPVGLNPKTLHRYRQLVEQQIIPYLGSVELQKLSEAHLQDWHGRLLASGGKGGRPLSAQTVKHCHRLLHTALARAVIGKRLLRNVASAVKPPKVEREEVPALAADQIGDMLAKIQDHRLYVPALVALGTGLRRGEILALRWQDVDLDKGTIQVNRSLGEAGEKSMPVEDRLYFKAPKSAAGRRSVSLAPSVVEALRTHRREQLELRMALGLGRPPHGAPVFSNMDGSPMSPDKLSRDWANLVRARKLPRVSFHALRHSHVSMLVSGGLDVFSVSRRIGHSSASLTLNTYTHMFTDKDDKVTEAVESALTQ